MRESAVGVTNNDDLIVSFIAFVAHWCIMRLHMESNNASWQSSGSVMACRTVEVAGVLSGAMCPEGFPELDDRRAPALLRTLRVSSLSVITAPIVVRKLAPISCGSIHESIKVTPLIKPCVAWATTTKFHWFIQRWYQCFLYRMAVKHRSHQNGFCPTGTPGLVLVRPAYVTRWNLSEFSPK